MMAKGMVLFDGKWVSESRRASLLKKKLEEKRAEIEENKDRSLWRNRHMETTKHFEFESTVPNHIFERFRDLMEAYYEEFAKEWKIRQPKDLGKLKVCFYVDREAFHQISGASRGVAGYFRFVEPMELDIYYDRRDLEFTEQVMYHEAGHYLQKLMDPDFKVPHFPGESLAEYYGASKFDPKTKKLEVGLVLEHRLTQIKDDIASGKKIELEKMIRTPNMFEHYSWGWSLVHFLMSDRTTAKQFQKFFKTLVSGKNVDRDRFGFDLRTVPTEEVWRLFCDAHKLKTPEDIKSLESAWHEYVEENLQFVTAAGYEKAGMSAVKGFPARPIRAKRLFQTAIDMGSTNARVYHEYGKLLEDDGDKDAALEHWKTALELDPLDGEIHFTVAKLQRERGQSEEALRIAKLAQELEPENLELNHRLRMILDEAAE